MKKFLLAAVVATGIALSPANATTFVFKGNDNNVTPLGTAGVDFQENCASTGDFCSIDHEAGLDYERGSIELQIRGYAGGSVSNLDKLNELKQDLGDFARIIQDIRPGDSGMGTYSETNTNDDQTQADTGESIEFIFDQEYVIKDVEFNAGGDRDCSKASDGSGEGSCGSFLLQVFNDLNELTSIAIVDMTNLDFTDFGRGARFLITALTEGSGFTIAQMTVNQVPVPGAIPLLLSGIAGLGFASRKKKAA